MATILVGLDEFEYKSFASVKALYITCLLESMWDLGWTSVAMSFVDPQSACQVLRPAMLAASAFLLCMSVNRSLTSPPSSILSWTRQSTLPEKFVKASWAALFLLGLAESI